MRYLLDTCTISELARTTPDKGVVTWAQGISEDQMAMSVLTIGELHKGIRKLPHSLRRDALEEWVIHDLVPRFGERLLQVSTSVATRWGVLQGDAARRGEPLPVIDSLIAATALEHDLTIVTRNTADLTKCGARVLNPWKQ